MSRPILNVVDQVRAKQLPCEQAITNQVIHVPHHMKATLALLFFYENKLEPKFSFL